MSSSETWTFGVVDQFDTRRLEVVVDELPSSKEHTTLACPLTWEGEAKPRTEGGALPGTGW